MDSNKRFYSRREAAQEIGVSLRTLDTLIAVKELQVRRIGRRVLVPASALDTFARHDHVTAATTGGVE